MGIARSAIFVQISTNRRSTYYRRIPYAIFACCNILLYDHIIFLFATGVCHAIICIHQCLVCIPVGHIMAMDSHVCSSKGNCLYYTIYPGYTWFREDKHHGSYPPRCLAPIYSTMDTSICILYNFHTDVQMVDTQLRSDVSRNGKKKYQIKIFEAKKRQKGTKETLFSLFLLYIL